MEKAEARNLFCQTWGHHCLEEDPDPRHCNNVTQDMAWATESWPGAPCRRWGGAVPGVVVRLGSWEPTVGEMR